MKLIRTILLTATILAVSLSAQKVNWEHNATEGFTLAKKQGKFVLLDAYTDWCGWCKVMDTATYAKKPVIDAIDKDFVAIKYNPEKDGDFQINGETVTQSEFGEKFHVTGYPSTLFFDAEGNFIQTVVGYFEADEFANQILPFILSDRAAGGNYSTIKYLNILDGYAKDGITAELNIAYAIIYIEVENNLEKALNYLDIIPKDDPLFNIAQNLRKIFVYPEENNMDEETSAKVNEIVDKYFR